MTARPDIVLLVLDTQRLDRLSCYGYTHETSPHLDTFAADATLFHQAYSTAQWTVPSHTSMFTGLYPGEHSMLHASSVLPPDLPTLAERLGHSGYFTAAFCNNPLIGVVNTGLQRGFHSFLNYSGLMTSRPNQEGIDSSLFDRYRHHFKRYVASALTSMQDIFARSDTLLDLSWSPLIAPLWQTALSFKGNTGRSLQDAARLHVERKGIEKNQPIFSFINLMGTHMPYHPPRAATQQFVPYLRQDKAARRQLRQFNSDVFGWLAPLAHELDGKSKALLDGMYDAEVVHQDELLEDFFQRFRSGGALDRTLFIICADHGEHLGEKQFMGHSLSLYNTLVHVPLIIRDPAGDFPRGTSVGHVVSTRRIFHSALTVAGAATQAEQTYSLAQSNESDPDGGQIYSVGVIPQNLVNVMKRRRPELITEQHRDRPHYGIIHERYKLIQTGDADLELYDILEDPDELVDLHDILPEQVERLQEDLHTFMRQASLSPSRVLEQRVEVPADPQVQRRLHDLGYLE